MHPERDTRIPVTIITGFLGSGKTTLLNHWVKQPELSDCAVLINEFGSVGLDHQLVKQVDEQVMLLDSGCICCSVQGSLATALQELFMEALRKEIRPFRRLIIETTGLADPAPVLFTLRQDNFIAERYRFDGIVTLVDAVHIEGQLTRQYEAVKQIALADLLVISKSDLVATEALAALQQIDAQLPELSTVRVATREWRQQVQVAEAAILGATTATSADSTPAMEATTATFATLAQLGDDQQHEQEDEAAGQYIVVSGKFNQVGQHRAVP